MRIQKGRLAGTPRKGPSRPIATALPIPETTKKKPPKSAPKRRKGPVQPLPVPEWGSSPPWRSKKRGKGPVMDALAIAGIPGALVGIVDAVKRVGGVVKRWRDRRQVDATSAETPTHALEADPTPETAPASKTALAKKAPAKKANTKKPPAKKAPAKKAGTKEPRKERASKKRSPAKPRR
jgi:hypothetical protein